MRSVPKLWWCTRHRAEKSFDLEGVKLCWKAHDLVIKDTRPCRFVEMQLASSDALVLTDMPSFVAALEVSEDRPIQGIKALEMLARQRG